MTVICNTVYIIIMFYNADIAYYKVSVIFFGQGQIKELYHGVLYIVEGHYECMNGQVEPLF